MDTRSRSSSVSSDTSSCSSDGSSESCDDNLSRLSAVCTKIRVEHMEDSPIDNVDEIPYASSESMEGSKKKHGFSQRTLAVDLPQNNPVAYDERDVRYRGESSTLEERYYPYKPTVPFDDRYRANKHLNQDVEASSRQASNQYSGYDHEHRESECIDSSIPNYKDQNRTRTVDRRHRARSFGSGKDTSVRHTAKENSPYARASTDSAFRCQQSKYASSNTETKSTENRLTVPLTPSEVNTLLTDGGKKHKYLVRTTECRIQVTSAWNSQNMRIVHIDGNSSYIRLRAKEMLLHEVRNVDSAR